MVHSRADLARKLLLPSRSVVSIDGLKADFLEADWRAHRRRAAQDFVVIGHPKALTAHALQRLHQFLARRDRGTVSGLAAYARLAGTSADSADASEAGATSAWTDPASPSSAAAPG
jgi:hypothetical protein